VKERRGLVVRTTYCLDTKRLSSRLNNARIWKVQRLAIRDWKPVAA
jgi:hypothetical protein